MKKNSGKNPAFQFYPNDWFRDLAEHPLEIEGAWIRIICKLWWAKDKGKLTKTIDQWAKMLGVSNERAEKVMRYFSEEKIAQVTFCNEKVTVKNRRMMRDNKLRKNNAIRQERYRLLHKSNADNNAPVAGMYEEEVEDEVLSTIKGSYNTLVPTCFKNDKFRKAFDDYNIYLKSINKSIDSIPAMTITLSTLEKYSNSDTDAAIGIMQKTIRNKWHNIYEPEKKGKKDQSEEWL